MVFVVAADDGEVDVVVITHVQGLPPDPLVVDQHREAAMLQPWLGDQRLGVVQEAVAVVSHVDQQDPAAEFEQGGEGRSAADGEVQRLPGHDLLGAGAQGRDRGLRMPAADRAPGHP
jgi:hypothetical protein